MLLQPLLQWQAAWAAECINFRFALVKNLSIFNALEFRALAQTSCASLCSLPEVSELIGVFFKAHVLEKYKYLIINASAEAEALFMKICSRLHKG